MTTPRNLRIGLPSKGRLAELAEELFQQSGLQFRRQERSLFARVKEMPLELIFLRADDVPVLCAEGALDMGVTGSDLVAESEAPVTERLRLGIGQCRLALCVPEESPAATPADLAGKRVATSFPNTTRDYFAAHGAEVRQVVVSGSVEIMVALGVADAVVDLVETGSTLAANRLRMLREIGSYETVLIQRRDLGANETADRVVRRLEGVIIARAYSLVEYNIPATKLEEARRITPGFNAPTVNALSEAGWLEVTAMVRRRDVIRVMEELEALGASAILETKIENCRL